MRLTKAQHRTIVEAARTAFGRNVIVRLFGSRVDDSRRGGDFDLYVECQTTDPDRLVRARDRFLCLLDASPELEGEKIDVVLSSPLHAEPRPIDRVARVEGVQL
jgi:predicted nucleotidyltransferase